MKKSIKVFYILLIIFLSGCGFKPVLTNTNFKKPKISELKIDGPSDLIFNIRSKIQIIETKNKKDPGLFIKISKTISPESKDTTGKVTSEKLTINCNYEIINTLGKKISSDSLVSTKLYPVTNSISEDKDKVSTEEYNLLNELVDKLNFKVALILMEK
jgi:outer membrane lipopolysaccharide assembly protein LptE/RlpB